MKIETFYFNPYRECTYVVYEDNQPQALIIDAGMYDEREEQRFSDFLNQHNLCPVALLITHTHPDHICGQEWLEKQYSLQAIVFPVEGMLSLPEPFANQVEVIHTPGHKEDAVCYYMPTQQWLFSGDTLFQESIGRTDLPGGDLQLLVQSLKKLQSLPGDTNVMPGHGYRTTIQHEIDFNPYLG